MPKAKNPKITGQPIGTFNGFTVYAKLQKAKREGKDRIWFQIRQDDPKEWHTSICLSYPRALDVQFQNR